ncbi:EamA family transporter [Akkermansia muciniphila]|nr:EamA family transporter [Akkermansia muciniphila]
MLDGKERTVHEYESQLVPGGVLHAVWNKNQEPAEILGLTLETPLHPHHDAMSSRQRTLGHAAALMTILIWGTTFVSTKVLLRDFTPVTVLFTRFVIGYAFLWCLKPRFLPFSGWKKEFLFAGAGLTGVTLYFLLENIALTYTFASNVGIIVAVVPFFTALLAHFLLKGKAFPAVSSWVLPPPLRVSSSSWQTEPSCWN